MKIAVCYGTRPEYIKIKPLISSFHGRIDFKTIYISQHKDTIGEHSPDLIIDLDNSGGNRLNGVFQQIFSKSSDLLSEFSHVLVQGDTATAAAMAISAFNSNKIVIHLEAGLRTYDRQNPFPEEIYRQMISRVSSVNLCPTKNNLKNLNNEKVLGKNFVVGNTCLDNLTGIPTTYGNKILVTLHRRENHPYIEEYFSRISDIALSNPNLEFILPIHPNPNVCKYKEILTGVSVVGALSHNDTINILKDCLFCITDSGGIQEEASFLKKKCIVCRCSTERQEGLGTFFHLCDSPAKLHVLFPLILADFSVNEPCPFGDGNSAKMITDLLLKNENIC